MSETPLRRAIIDALAAIGVEAYHVQAGKVRARRGWLQLAPEGTPDLYVPGFGHLEVKLPGEKPRPNQVLRHARLREAGDRVAVVSSVREAIDVVGEWRKVRRFEQSMGWR